MNTSIDIFEFLTPKKTTHYLNADSTIRQAIEKFDHHKFSVVSVIDKGGKFVSTISEGDILRYIKNTARFDITLAENVCIGEIERYRPYAAVGLCASMKDIFSAVLDQNFVPVVDDRGVFSGIIKRRTVLNYLIRNSGVEL